MMPCDAVPSCHRKDQGDFFTVTVDSLMVFALGMTTSQVTTKKHIMGWIWRPWGHAVRLPNGTVVKSGNGFPHENAV